MPNTTCDLHLHTYYSDGKASPGQVLRYAAGLGLKTVAITDHDNLNGVEEAAFVAAELGLELVPALELTCRWDECWQAPPGEPNQEDVHILGYFVDPGDPGLLEFTRRAIGDFEARLEACTARLRSEGQPLSWAEVKAENPRYTGLVQLVDVLQRKAPGVGWGGAAALVESHWRRGAPSGQTAGEVIEAIHRAGGAAVLAHPVSVRCGEERLPAERLARLVDLGLDGLEIYHPRLGPEERQYFSTLAQRFNLVQTGGSDEHGRQGGFLRLGSEPAPYSMVAELRARSRAGRAT